MSDRPPEGYVSNPEIIAECRRRNWPAAPAALADAAALTGKPLHVLATEHSVKAGLAELQRITQRQDTQRAHEREMEKLKAQGFKA